MKKIIYLGELTLEEAIDKAASLGMEIPNYQVMNALYNFFKGLEMEIGYPVYKRNYLTSTTYAFDTNKFITPVDKPIIDIQQPDSDYCAKKSIKRKAYAVSKGTTVQDIETFNFYFDLPQ